MERDIFQNTKSVNILERLINFVVEDNDLVLDFFSGSGTTAEAVMRINAKRALHLKYIMVQIEEDLDESIADADSRAKKTLQNAIKFLDSIRMPHTICEIGKERIRRVGEKINKEYDAMVDIGFRVLRLDSTNMNDV